MNSGLLKPVTVVILLGRYDPVCAELGGNCVRNQLPNQPQIVAKMTGGYQAGKSAQGLFWNSPIPHCPHHKHQCADPDKFRCKLQGVYFASKYNFQIPCFLPLIVLTECSQYFHESYVEGKFFSSSMHICRMTTM